MKALLTGLLVIQLFFNCVSASECTPELRFDGKKLILTEEQWKERLTPEQYHVLGESGTEPAFANEYYDNKEKGLYLCAACNLALFSSEDIPIVFQNLVFGKEKALVAGRS